MIAAKGPPENVFHNGFDALPPPPPNDTCATAASLLIGAPANGTTIGASADYNSGLETCTGFSQSGADVAFSVLLLGSQSVTVTLSAPAATFDPSISVIGPGTASACQAATLTCVAGADMAGFGVGESFQFTPTTTGTYYIIVDSYYGAGNEGAFTIKVSTP